MTHHEAVAQLKDLIRDRKTSMKEEDNGRLY